MKQKLAGWAGAAIALVAFASPCAATQQIISPTTSFTARLIGGINVLVGAPDGTEGTPWLSTFLDMKEGTSDRTVLEYDLRGLAATPKATLYLELTNLDVPRFTPIYMYSFKGNGLANAADYYRTDSYITTFTDNGLASNFIPPYHIPFSFDLTSAFNQAVAAGDDYLGILLHNSVAGPQYARYRLTTFAGLPKLAIGVPEPSAVCLASTIPALLITIGRRYRRDRDKLAPGATGVSPVRCAGRACLPVGLQRSLEDGPAFRRGCGGRVPASALAGCQWRPAQKKDRGRFLVRGLLVLTCDRSLA